MSEVDRRRSYWYNAVLIESDRVLTPQVADAVIYVTGAQVEMLRNITQYLIRRNTYVSESHLGYYLVPDDSDYDEILAIVADLEETLMGNPNTIWGYSEVKILDGDHTKSGAGDDILYTGQVPEFEVWRLDSIVAQNDDTACSRIEIVFDHPAMEMILAAKDNPAAGELVRWDGILTMSQSMRLYVKFYDCLDGDYNWFQARGHLVTVP